MFSLTRSAAKRIPRPLIRSLSDVVNSEHQASVTALPPSSVGPSRGRRTSSRRTASNIPFLPSEKVPVAEDHGLYAFFRKKTNGSSGEEGYEVVESPQDAQLRSGRSWQAPELRNKSFKDLHTLWYIVLREKNLLATQKEEARRMGVANTSLQVSMDKVRSCRKTMARIKAVLNERRIAFEGAVQLAEEQADIERRQAEQAELPNTKRETPGARKERKEQEQQILAAQKATARRIKAEARLRKEEPLSPWNAHRTFGRLGGVLQIDSPDSKLTPKKTRVALKRGRRLAT